MNIVYDLLLITGPTASGKTHLAAAIAYKTNGEIISADSRQVYRRMNIGTGKDYDDYIVDGKPVPFHLIDIAEPGYKYNVFEYQRDFINMYNKLLKSKKFPVVCGGSGLYVDSIISGYRFIEVPHNAGLRKELEKKSMQDIIKILSTYKKLHNITDTDTRERVIRAIEIEQYHTDYQSSYADFPIFRSLVVGVTFDREARRRRITQRLKQRLGNGMVEEVKQLLSSGIESEILIYYGLEYKYITLYLAGKISYDEMFSRLEIAIHQFAKRQMTWFRGMERRGTKIHWLDGNMPMEEKAGKIMEWLCGELPET